ncbi:KAP family NTPase [Nocardioides marinus]|nr:KAP family NTPase [Nocardioides marinus]
MSNKVDRRILQDEPSEKDLFNGGGHERTAHSLSKAIVRFDSGDSAIGLEGSWGSGKSSVVEMAKRKLSEKNGKGKKTYNFFTFDIWKSQGSDFRRSFLEHFLNWAQMTFPKKRHELAAIEAQIQGKTREIQTNNQPILDWYGITVLVFLPFLPLYYFWAKTVFDEAAKAGSAGDFLCSTPFLLLLAFVIATLALAGCKFRSARAKDPKTDFKAVISRLLLIRSRQHQDHKVVQKVREIDPNDYEFHSTLREILGVVQSEHERVVVVLDNIDRLPGKEIRDYWALVRSIFARAHGEIIQGAHTEITAIVPYDRKLIEANVTTDEDEETGRNDISCLASRELFSKTFSEILSVSPPVLSNAREFFADRLEEALPKQVSADDRFRTYRIFCELLKTQGGTTTPRNIVSFVNNLSSLYELHNGKFRLPTVAAYIAHQDRIRDKPSVLNEKTGLDPRISALSGDSKLTKNLAAMVFNVEEDLAFQILLDDEIAEAILSPSPDRILALSSAPGFDDRVDDVVQANVDEWRSTGDLGTAIRNISELHENYEGDAKKHLASTVLRAFSKVETLPIKGEGYVEHLPIFSLATESQLPETVDYFVNAVLAGVHQQEKYTFQDGKAFSSFLVAVAEALEKHGGAEALNIALGEQTLPTAPEYMFGLAATIATTGFDLSSFSSAEIALDEDLKYLEEQFVKYPGLAIPALEQFTSNDLLPDQELVSIANAALSALKTGEVPPGNASALLEIAAITWQSVDESKRAEILLANATTEGQFFRNIGDGSTVESQTAQANLLFLAQEQLGKGLSTPTKLNPNNTRAPDPSDGFSRFKDLLDGSGELLDSQVELVAHKAVAARGATRWIVYGKANREHSAVAQIVVEMFSRATPPYLTLQGLTSHFPYLRDLLEEDVLVGALGKYAPRMDVSEIKKLTLDDIPRGFLSLSHATGGLWNPLHEHVGDLLSSVEQQAWPDHISEMDHTALVLLEKLDSSGCQLDAGVFRKPFVHIVKHVLSGESEIEAADGALDALLRALDKSYHEDVWRSLREGISNVSATSLGHAMQLCPELISNVAQRGDRIMKAEKDNVLRHILVPALEGRQSDALRIFVGMGYSKLKDFQNAAQDSTTAMVEGAWKSFSNANVDRNLMRDLSEVLFGKRKAKSILDPSFWLSLPK